MRGVAPSVQMQQALTHDLRGGFTAQAVRQFARRAAEFLFQVGIKEQVEVFFGRGHYDRNSVA